MSLVLKNTIPADISVKTTGHRQVVYFGAYEISLMDFLQAAVYVLVNTDLVPNDYRLAFLRHVGSMREVEGYNTGQKRLEATEPLS